MRIAFNKPVETMPLYCDSVGYDWDLDWSQYLRQVLRDIQNRVYLPQLK